MPNISRTMLENLRNGQAPESQRIIREERTRGFGVLFGRSKTLSFFCEGRIKGASGSAKRVQLGRYPQMKVEEARDRALEYLRLMREGVDPVKQEEEAIKQRSDEAAAEEALQKTLREVMTEYFEVRPLKPSTRYDYENTISVCFGDWLDQPVRNITRRSVQDQFKSIKDRVAATKTTDGKAQSVKAFRILSTMLNFAKGDEVGGTRLLTDNPCEVLKDRGVDRRIPKRKTVLSEQDIAGLLEEFSIFEHPQYKDLDNALTNKDAVNLIELLLFTGLRFNEGASLKWENVNMRDRYFVIPDTKNSRDHYVPMSGHVEKVFKNLKKAAASDAVWVFPGKRGEGPIRDIRKQLGKLEARTGLSFSPHDLRRTFASIGDRYGLSEGDIGRALNHSEQTITQGYIISNVESLRPTFDKIAEQMLSYLTDDPVRSKMSDAERREWDEASGDPGTDAVSFEPYLRD